MRGSDRDPLAAGVSRLLMTPVFGCLSALSVGLAVLLFTEPGRSVFRPYSTAELEKGVKAARDEAYFEALTAAIRRSEPALLRHAEHGLRGVDSQKEGKECCPSPILDDPEFEVSCVTRDANQNVYFILADSWVTFNVGFILQSGDRPFLGDGQEPNIRFTKHLFGRWWYYTSS